MAFKKKISIYLNCSQDLNASCNTLGKAIASELNKFGIILSESFSNTDFELAISTSNLKESRGYGLFQVEATLGIDIKDKTSGGSIFYKNIKIQGVSKNNKNEAQRNAIENSISIITSTISEGFTVAF